MIRARGVFVTATGTDAGKTFFSRGLARLLTRRFTNVAALKPLETGCTPDPLDAIALARAARNPDHANDPDFYRAGPALAPYAAALSSEEGPTPDLARLVAAVTRIALLHDFTIVEGAGGLLVPLDAQNTIADLVERLAFPLLLVAPDRLGTISHVLTAYESAIARRLEVAAVILTGVDAKADPSTVTNAEILAARLPVPVVTFPHTANNDESLATAIASTPIPDLVLSL